jgi:NAD-dependent deacetylase
VTDAGLRTAADALRRAPAVAILTGAGVSAASGVPTFRGAEGLWKNVRAESLATPEAFERDPTLVWEWYDWRRQMIRGVAPNDAHRVLARWTRERPSVTLITQNVDGLHERAGADRLTRLHGSIWHLRCWRSCARGALDWFDDTVPLPTLPPRCPYCGGLARPAVVWFGERLDANALDKATRAAVGASVFFAIGTSAVVYPAAGLLHHARQHGAFTIEINAEATAASEVVDLALRGTAEEVLATLDRAL